MSYHANGRLTLVMQNHYELSNLKQGILYSSKPNAQLHAAYYVKYLGLDNNDFSYISSTGFNG